jgi:hypothetical protein
MNEIKMMVITTGGEWKKILGKIVNDLPMIYELSDAIILEEMMSDDGIRIMPIPLGPKAENETFKIKKECVMIEPYTPTKNVIDMYNRATSNLVVPSPSNLVI